MKKLSGEEFEQHLKLLNQVKEVESDEFFYTRLRGRMQSEDQQGWLFPLKPAWLIGCMAIFLAANTVVVIQGRMEKRTEQSATLKDFAKSYDQTISTTY